MLKVHDIRPFIPELFNEPGSLLYIGARLDAHSWLDELIAAGHNVSILEIWEENAIGLEKFYDVPIVLGSVVDYTESYYGAFDYIFWWHGPEHLIEREIPLVLERLELRTRKLIAIACPYGLYPQGTHEGNPYEEHKTTLYPEFFIDLGFNVKIDGEPDVAGGEIVAWKKL